MPSPTATPSPHLRPVWPDNSNSPESFAALYDIMTAECPQCAIFKAPDTADNKKTFLAGGFYVYRYATRIAPDPNPKPALNTMDRGSVEGFSR